MQIGKARRLKPDGLQVRILRWAFFMDGVGDSSPKVPLTLRSTGFRWSPC